MNLYFNRKFVLLSRSVAVNIAWKFGNQYCYFTGRGFKSHAYTHSVQDGHHVFLNLETHKFYCLPDNYEIIDQSLEDIVVCTFSSS